MNPKLSLLVATLFGTGYFPKAPGTVGSFVSLPVIFLVCFYFGLKGLLFLIIGGYIIALISIHEVLKRTKHDPGFVVIDEFIGQSVSFLFIANYLKNNTDNLWLYIMGFLFFRLFDVKKPFPVGYIDKNILNANGVILDDVVAGLYSAIFVYAIYLIMI